MSYSKHIQIITIVIGIALCGLYSKPLGAYAEDMSSREVEALLMDRMDGVSKKQVHSLTRHLMKLCKKYNFSVSSVLSVIAAESSFNKEAVSPVGARGLMQVMPATAKYVADRANIVAYHNANDLFNPSTNVSIGIAYLSQLRDRYVKSHHYLAAYNLGPSKYNRMVRNRMKKPESVQKYIRTIHSGVFSIRHDAQALAYAQ